MPLINGLPVPPGAGDATPPQIMINRGSSHAGLGGREPHCGAEEDGNGGPGWSPAPGASEVSGFQSQPASTPDRRRRMCRRSSHSGVRVAFGEFVVSRNGQVAWQRGLARVRRLE